MSRQIRAEGWAISHTGRSGHRGEFISQMVLCAESRGHVRGTEDSQETSACATREARWEGENANPEQESQYPFELKYLDRIQLKTRFKIPATWFGVTVLVLLIK